VARGRRRFKQQHRRPNLMAGVVVPQYGGVRATGRRLGISAMYVSLLARGKYPLTRAVAAKIVALP